MPGQDGTGPMGMGGMTGRAAGRCAAADGPAPTGRGRGQGLGMGRGGGRGGRGWRWMFRATGLTGGPRTNAAVAPALPEEQELAVLKQQAASLEHALGELNAALRLTGPAATSARAGQIVRAGEELPG
jgi:hypothetical protein